MAKKFKNPGTESADAAEVSTLLERKLLTVVRKKDEELIELRRQVRKLKKLAALQSGIVKKADLPKFEIEIERDEERARKRRA